MKKRICELKPGTPFKCRSRVFIKDDFLDLVCLTDGESFSDFDDFFSDGDKTLVTVCRRIKKSDIKERK